jgi:hypothetical protein
MAVPKKKVKKAPAKEKAAVKKAQAVDGKSIADDLSTPENEHLGEVREAASRKAQLATPGGGGRRLGGRLVG